jgi:hypothetical protein
VTNWTPLSVAQHGRSILFLRLKSYASSDGSGIPDWWEQQYGLTNVNPNALDSIGDGWTIYQKYTMGVAPNAWVTPAAPQSVTATVHQPSKTASISWLPARGSVTGYVVEKVDNYPAWGGIGSPTTNYVSVSASATNYLDNISGNEQNPYDGDNYELAYCVKAVYGGNSSAWSAMIAAPLPTVSAFVAPGTNGTTFLGVSGVPANAPTIRLVFIDQWAGIGTHDPEYDFTLDYPVSSFSNGLLQLTTEWPLTDAGGGDYIVYAESVAANGDESAATVFDDAEMYSPAAYNWGQPFYDGRVQMKQNLIFQLRAAPADGPLEFGYGDTYLYPLGYAVASLYQYADQSSDPLGYFDSFLPYEQNYLFRNFVYSITNVDGNGNLTTGVYGSGSPYSQISNPTFVFNSSVTPYQSWLSTNSTTWLYYAQLNDSDDLLSEGIVTTSTDNQGNITISVPSGKHNWFGLPYSSIGVAGTSASTGNPVNDVITAGHSMTSADFQTGYTIYPQTAQPQLQTVEYDFWSMQDQDYSFTSMPGDPSFSATNKSQLLITSVGNEAYLVAGYAKMAVENSTYGQNAVFGYLGQYFSGAYTMTNGVATGTNTGFVSPYGNFTATQPGPTALITMPDPDTGARGTGTVYVVSLQVDKNHDGTMDLSFNGLDVTTTNSPMIFWANNNFDRSILDSDDNTNYDDDAVNTSEAATCPFAPQTPTPDCNYRDQYGNRMIPCARDLEDFARLWICGINSTLVSNLPAGSTISLNWGDVGAPNPNNPTIDIFSAVETNGGIGYLTNAVIAQQQANPFYTSCVGRVGPGQSLQLYPPLPYGGNYWQGSHYIWCGVSNGTGGLNLTIADGKGNVLAQTTAFIQIEDIKQMYERWTVGENPNLAPTNVAQLGAEDLPTGIPGFQYPLPTDTNTPYILFVHGWNMNRYDKDRFAETAFKRLYWQGYHGRFGVFRWPTAFDFNGTFIDAILQPHNFDGSENQAWNSAAGLLNKLSGLNAEYPGHVYVLAHSMGNVVTGEALRLAAQQGLGQIVNTYVASQGAIPAHVYDATVTAPYLINYNYYAHYDPAPGAPKTPNIYGNRLTNNIAAVGSRISRYNVNDYALNADAWCFDQEHKPDTYLTGIYNYNGTTNDPAPWNNFYWEPFGGSPVFLDIVNSLSSRYTVLAFAANPYSTALGATATVTTLTRNVNMTSSANGIWPSPDPLGKSYSSHFWHSAQFRGDLPWQWGYWNTLLLSSQSGFGIANP